MAPPVLTMTPLTELDAVNVLLASIGKTPVNTLAVSGITDVNTARLTLHNESRNVQLRGWHFNTEERFPFTRDVNGKIEVPPNALSIDPSDRWKDYVQRKDPADSKLRFYDRRNHTFVLPSDIEVNVKWFLSFEELPAAARAYITAVAGRRFQANRVASDLLYAFSEQYVKDCAQAMDADELASADTNFFTSDYDTARIVYRERF